jgi:hypothetical protein
MINPATVSRFKLTPDIPDVVTYFNQDKQTDPEFWDMRKITLDDQISIIAFISVSTNLSRLKKEPTTADVVVNYDYYCEKYDIPVSAAV